MNLGGHYCIQRCGFTTRKSGDAFKQAWRRSSLGNGGSMELGQRLGTVRVFDFYRKFNTFGREFPQKRRVDCPRPPETSVSRMPLTQEADDEENGNDLTALLDEIFPKGMEVDLDVDSTSAFEKDEVLKKKGTRNSQPPPSPNDKLFGRGMLLVVALLWGTYAPALKYIYSLPGPPTPSTLTAVRAIIGAVILIGFTLFGNQRNRMEGSENPVETSEGDPFADGNNGSFWLDPGKLARGGVLGFCRNALTWSSGSLLVSGMELGLWNFLGSSCQAIGLEHTTATRAAFLIQSTALFTPMIATVAGDRLLLTGWIGCAAGLLGSVLVTFEAKSQALQALSLSMEGIGGDAIVLAAALFYALGTVRLGTLAQRFASIDLAAAKTVTLAAISVTWVMSDCLGLFVAGSPIGGLWSGIGDWRAWVVLFWAAIGPGALASVLQTAGQKSVRPAQSQVFFASTPFWSALIAGSFLTGEFMGFGGWLGGIIIICGGILSSLELRVGQAAKEKSL